MRLYTVHIRPTSEAPDHEAILVREGFSWGAFLFTFLWALWRRMWLAAFLILLGAILLDSLARLAYLDELSEVVLIFAYHLFVGFSGNDWRRRNLARRGFQEVAAVGASGMDEATRRYFDHMTTAKVVAL